MGYERGCRDARRSSRWRRSPGFEGKRRGFRTEGAGRISGPEGKALYPRGRRGRARNSPEKGESGGTSRFRTSKPAGRRRRVRVRRSRRTLSRDPLRGDGRGTRSGDVRSRPFPRRGRRRDRRGASRPPRRRGGLRGGARRSGAKDRSKNGEGRRRSRGGAEGGGTRGGPSLRSFPASSPPDPKRKTNRRRGGSASFARGGGGGGDPRRSFPSKLPGVVVGPIRGLVRVGVFSPPVRTSSAERRYLVDLASNHMLV